MLFDLNKLKKKKNPNKKTNMNYICTYNLNFFFLVNKKMGRVCDLSWHLLLKCDYNDTLGVGDLNEQ